MIRGLVLVVRFLFWLLVIRLAFRAAASFFRPRTEAPKKRIAAELVRDRMCNTFVPRDRAVVATVGGKSEYFCSAACRDRALHLAARAS